MISRAGWCSLQLAAACIGRDADLLSHAAAAIASEFDTKDIREIWHKAKLSLHLADVHWMKEQLVSMSQEAVAA